MSLQNSSRILMSSNISLVEINFFEYFSVFQVTLQQGCNKILVSDCYTLLQRQFRNLSRGHSIKEETKCGGCRGHIVSLEATSHCDTFVFNCKHAFHEDCLADDGGGVSEDGKLTSTINCTLCHPNRK